MYRLFFSILAVIFLFQLNAQDQTSGRILYAVEHLERYTNPRVVQHNLDGSLKRVFKQDSIAKSVLASDDVLFQLDFNAQYYHFYMPDIDEESEDILRRSFGGIKDYFFDVGAASFVYHYDLEQHNHLVEGDPFYTSENWHITKETKEIAGYTCTKAILMQDYESIYETYAWFTEAIPIDFGSLGYMALPGVILALETNHRLIYALEVDLKQEPKIKLPGIKTFTTAEHHEVVYGDLLSRH